MSSIVDYTDRTTCILFGDGCGVVLMEPNHEDLGDSAQEIFGADLALMQKQGALNKQHKA